MLKALNEDLKCGYMRKETKELQVFQNDMLRTICGIKREQRVNLQKLREEKRIMSVNQLSIYHTLIEAYNVVEKTSSEKIRRKIVNTQEGYSLRSTTNKDLIVPSKTRASCQGFSYFAAKLYNKIPTEIRNAKENIYKNSIKDWIWENIPSK